MDATLYQMDKRIIRLWKDQVRSQTYGPLTFHGYTHKTGLLLQQTVNVILLYSSHSYLTSVTLPIPAKCLIHNNPIDTLELGNNAILLCMGSRGSRIFVTRPVDLSMINISYMQVYDAFGKSCFWRNLVIQELHYRRSLVWYQAHRPMTCSYFFPVFTSEKYKDILKVTKTKPL
jgi:hypothetical protein